jgi:16S rRNA (guanine(966)-N(2))-methyltransferase RsmD
MIRVISGIYKGKRLKLVKSPFVRPMPDKLKGALFSIIQERINGSVFLDGFAGTGSVGIEALSRGASQAVFIDEFYPAIKVLRTNLEKCGAQAKSRVLHKEFNRAVILLAKEKAAFDIIFLDPPYRLLETRNPLKVIKKRGILKENGMLILRHHRKIRPDARYFALSRTAVTGDDVLSFFG